MSVLKRYTGSAWESVGAIVGAPDWQAWTPALTAVTTNPTLGTGSAVAGRYTQHGKTVIGWGSVVFGSSGTGAGSGEYRLSLPVPPATPGTTVTVTHGIGWGGGGGVFNFEGVLEASTTTLRLFMSSGTVVGAAAPVAWGANGELRYWFSYEAATSSLALTGSTVAVVGATRSSGNVTLNGTSWGNVDTGVDLTIAAVATDWLEVSINGRLAAGAANTHTIFDIATIVSASPVNYFGVGGGGSDEGLNGLRVKDTDDRSLSGSFLYQVQAGDVSGGNVVLRLRYRQSTAGDRAFVAGTTNPFKWWVKNYG